MMNSLIPIACTVRGFKEYAGLMILLLYKLDSVVESLQRASSIINQWVFERLLFMQDLMQLSDFVPYSKIACLRSISCPRNNSTVQ
jgi:hypothetical protein